MDADRDHGLADNPENFEHDLAVDLELARLAPRCPEELGRAAVSDLADRTVRERRLQRGEHFAVAVEIEPNDALAAHHTDAGTGLRSLRRRASGPTGQREVAFAVPVVRQFRSGWDRDYFVARVDVGR